ASAGSSTNIGMWRGLNVRCGSESSAEISASGLYLGRRAFDAHVEPPPFVCARRLDGEDVLRTQFVDEPRGRGYRFERRAGEAKCAAGPLGKVAKVCGFVARSVRGLHHEAFIAGWDGCNDEHGNVDGAREPRYLRGG